MKAIIGKRGILQLVAALALLTCALGPARGSVQAASSRYFPETDKTSTIRSSLTGQVMAGFLNKAIQSPMP